jgi:hypothetical protein
MCILMENIWGIDISQLGTYLIINNKNNFTLRQKLSDSWGF